MAHARLAEVVRSNEQTILSEWMTLQLKSIASRRDLISEAELQRQSKEFLAAFARALEQGTTDLGDAQWGPVKDVLNRVSSARATQGFSPSETAVFVFSLKQPVFAQLRKRSTD